MLYVNYLDLSFLGNINYFLRTYEIRILEDVVLLWDGRKRRFADYFGVQ